MTDWTAFTEKFKTAMPAILADEDNPELGWALADEERRDKLNRRVVGWISWGPEDS